MNFQIIISITIFTFGNNFAFGKHNLPFLTLLPFGRNGQVQFAGCNAAADIVIDNVNNRDDILPNYLLNRIIRDEGPSAVKSNPAVVNFVRENENQSIAPVIFGPMFACHLSGGTTKEMGFVSISPGCIGQYIIDRKKFFRLYSSQSPAMNMAWAMMAFVKRIGKWSEIAVVTHNANPNEYLLAEYVAEIATSSGVEVLHYSNDVEISEDTFVVLKATKARIIATSIFQRPICVQFMCLALHHGMLAPGYLFLFAQNCFFDNAKSVTPLLPPNCTVAMIEEFMKIVIGFGGVKEPMVNDLDQVKSELGYSAGYFEEKYRDKTSGVVPFDNNLPYVCHDAMMTLVVALNKTETILQSTYNSSLMAFEDNLKLVQELIDSSIRNQQFEMLRIGQVRYEADGELVEDHLIVQMKNGTARPVFLAKYKTTKSKEITFDETELIELEPIEWQTDSGNPPKDLSQVEIRPIIFNLVLIPVALLVISIGQIISALCFNKQKTKLRKAIKFGITVGCLSINLTAAIAIVGLNHFPLLACLLRIPLAAFSFSFLNTCLLVLSINYQSLAKLNRIIGDRTRSGSGASNKTQSRYQARTLSNRFRSRFGTLAMKKQIHIEPVRLSAVVFGLFLSVTFLTTFIWTSVDPLHLTTFRSSVKFDKESDNYFLFSWTKCSSSSFHYWLLVTVLFQMFLLGLSAWFAHRSGKLISQFSSNIRSTIRQFQLGITNAFTLILGSILILIILDGSHDEKTQLIIFTVACAILSGNIHFVVFLPKRVR